MFGIRSRASESLASTFKSGPIFIGGPDRCGKTTMRAFLVSHPNISIPAVGSNMWTYFYARCGDLRDAAGLERCLSAMLRYKHVRFLRPDADRVRREFLSGERTYARLFAIFQQHHAQKDGKPRWGDQTALVERYADQIFAAYPGAKFIHMIRDPRDRYEASITLWPNGRGKVGGAVARWLYSVRLAKRHQLRYPDSYKVVRFEDLVLQPERTLRGVCEFLNEEFTAEMLNMDGDPGFREKTRTTPEQPLLSSDFIGRFRRKMNEREILFMQMHAGREMLELGYWLENVRLSAREWLRFSFIDYPGYSLRGIAWRSLEALQQAFPRVVPRPISADKRM